MSFVKSAKRKKFRPKRQDVTTRIVVFDRGNGAEMVKLIAGEANPQGILLGSGSVRQERLGIGVQPGRFRVNVRVTLTTAAQSKCASRQDWLLSLVRQNWREQIVCCSRTGFLVRVFNDQIDGMRSALPDFCVVSE